MNEGMAFEDSALLIPCGDPPLVGILSRPAQPRGVGLVVVVGGAQYRVGAHRQFLLLARCLAQAGYPVLRFDFHGMGDSGGEARGFESVGEEIAAAVQALREACPQVRQVALWGLCDGASAALMYAGEAGRPAVSGLCLLNPWVRSEVSLARTHVKHYYRARLLQGDLWRKLLTGRFDWRGSMASAWRNLRAARGSVQPAGVGDAAPFQDRMARAWQRFPGTIGLILSSEDITAKEFTEHASTDPAWAGWQSRPGLQRCDVAGADHTFSQTGWRQAVERATLAFLADLEARA